MILFIFACMFSIFYSKIRKRTKRRKKKQEGRLRRDGNKAKMHPETPYSPPVGGPQICPYAFPEAKMKRRPCQLHNSQCP